MGADHTEQTEICVLSGNNKPEYGYKSDRNMASNQTKQTTKWLLNRRNGPKHVL